MSNRIPQDDILIEKNKVDFSSLISKMLSNWYWFVISLIVCFSLSYLYLRYTSPIYKTSSRVLITSDKPTTPGEDELTQALGGQLGSTSTVEGEAEILKTRHLMVKVVKDLKSYITYFHKGKVRSIDLYQSGPFKLTLFDSPDSIRPVSMDVHLSGNKVILSNKTYNKQVNLYQRFIIPGLGRVQIEKGEGKPEKSAIYTVNVSTVNQAVGAIMAKMEVTIPIKQVDIIALSMTSQIPKSSEDIINKLIEEYVHGNVEDKNKIADSTIAFIDNRLIYVGQELGKIEGNVQSFKQENKIADITAQAGLLVSTTGSNKEDLAKIETQISVLSSIENYLTSSGSNQRIVPSGALMDDPGFTASVERYNAIVLEKEKSSIGQTEDNPYMKNLNQQIVSARADMLTSIRGLKRSLNVSKQKLDARSNSLAGNIRQVPAVERKYLDLTRQQDIKQALYTFLLQKREETAISKTSNISSCKVIEPPVSEGPISPVRGNVYGYGIIAGLFLPFAVLFLGDRLDTKVASVEQVRSRTNVSVIGEIGQSNTTDGTIVVSQGSRTPISEQFRSLRTNLTFFLKESEKTILLTSSMSGEGKSFISLNLATVLAISGKKVIVMEMDLRKPNLSSKLNIRNDYGFTNYIVSKDVTPDDVIKPSGTHENLFIISSGNIPPNPTEIILSERMDVLMAALVEKFDFIIIDAPPIGMVTDAQLLSKYADLTLYAVRQGYTFKDQLEIPQEIYVNQKMKNIAILMNDVKNNKSYGYGYGYGVEVEKKGFFSRLFNK